MAAVPWKTIRALRWDAPAYLEAQHYLADSSLPPSRRSPSARARFRRAMRWFSLSAGGGHIVLNDGARYTLLGTIRAFSAEQLHAGGGG